MAIKCPRCGWRFGGVTKEDVREMRKEYAKAFMPWTAEDDKLLLDMQLAETSLADMSRRLERQPSAVAKRLELHRAGRPASLASTDVGRENEIAKNPLAYSEKALRGAQTDEPTGSQ